MKTLHLTDEQHQRGLAWIRRMALLTGDIEGEEILDWLDVDRPRGDVVPLASRRVDLDDPKWETGRRVTRLERLGQAEARAQRGGVL